MKSVARYSAVLGRSPYIRTPSSRRPGIEAYGFPALPRSFWRSLVSEAHDTTVFFTAGMSGHPMPVPAPEREIHPQRVELMAVCDGRITGGPSGTEDVVTALLLAVADYVLDAGIFVGVGHTLDLQEPLATNTAMSAFLFTPPEGMDEKRLCRCTGAQAVLNVVPITAAELEVARKQGVAELVGLFEASKVRPVFDFARASAA